MRRLTSVAEGFDLARVRGGVSGLGLVRALLPRRSATLASASATSVSPSNISRTVGVSSVSPSASTLRRTWPLTVPPDVGLSQRRAGAPG